MAAKDKSSEKDRKELSRLLRKGRLDEAAAFLEVRLMREPENWEHLYDLSQVRLMQERIDEGKDLLRRAATLSGNGFVNWKLGELLVGLGSYSEARSPLEKAFRQYPRNARVRALLGKSYIETGAMRDGEVHLRRAVQLDPKDPDGRHWLATLLVDENRVDEARELLEDYLKSNPDLPSSHAFMAEFQHWTMGDHLAALPHYERALLILSSGKWDKAVKLYFSTFGYPLALLEGYLECLLECGLHEAAEVVAREHLSRGSLAAWKARLAAKKGELSTAVSELQECLEQDPDNPSCMYHLGILMLRQNDNPLAERWFRKAIEASRLKASTPTVYLLGLAISLRRQGRTGEAREIEAGAYQEPKTEVLKAELHIWFELGEWQRVIEVADEALGVDPQWPYVLTHKAAAHAALEQHDKAIAAYQGLLRLQPRNGRAMLQMAMAHSALGRTSDAIEILERALSNEVLSPKEQEQAKATLSRLKRELSDGS